MPSAQPTEVPSLMLFFIKSTQSLQANLFMSLCHTQSSLLAFFSLRYGEVSALLQYGHFGAICTKHDKHRRRSRQPPSALPRQGRGRAEGVSVLVEPGNLPSLGGAQLQLL